MHRENQCAAFEFQNPFETYGRDNGLQVSESCILSIQILSAQDPGGPVYGLLSDFVSAYAEELPGSLSKK